MVKQKTSISPLKILIKNKQIGFVKGIIILDKLLVVN